MAITRATASSVIQGLPKSKSTLAGNLPILSGSYESIQTINVSSATSSVSFTSIPSTYKHLQIRYSALTSRGTYGSDGVLLRFNGDTGANYSWHATRGRGDATPYGGGGGGETSMYFDWGFGTTVASHPAVGVYEILDYANTSKTKTLRGINALDINGAISGYYGAVTQVSGGWYYSGNPAITSITFISANGANIETNSTFALYGIKG